MADANREYTALLQRIEYIHERAADASKEQSNRVLLEARWLTGKHLVEVEQDGKLRAAYGDKLLERLAEDLQKRHGRGWSARNLREMRRFHTLYRVEAIRPTLGWSHYRRLMMVEDRRRRDQLEQRAIREGWSVQRLAEEVRDARAGEGDQEKEPLQFARVTGFFYIYAIHSGEEAGHPDEPAVLDLGFAVWRREPAIHDLEPGGYVQAVKHAHGYDFIPMKAEEAEESRYIYTAKYNRTIDGDTLEVWMDLGFGILSRERVRLRGVNAPEANTAGAESASEFVTRELGQTKLLVIRTVARDAYGRYIADVYYGDATETDPTAILKNGRHLSEEVSRNLLKQKRTA